MNHLSITYTDHEDSFCSGYNSCLVEMSGSLMTANDIDYNTKSILLMLISKHSTTRHTAVAKKLLEDKKTEQQKQQERTCLSSSIQRDVSCGSEKCASTVINNQPQQVTPVNKNTSNQLSMPSNQQSTPVNQPSVPRKQYQPPRSINNQQKPVAYVPIPQQCTAYQTQQQKPIQIISQQQQQQPPQPNSRQSPCYPQQQHQPATNRSPLSNIKNIQAEPSHSCSARGMKRSHSDTSMEKENHKRTRMETAVRKQTVYQQRSTTPDCSKIVEFKPIAAPANEKQEFQFQQGVSGTPSWNNSCTIDNTNIAVLQKGADGKLTRISNIPLKALIGNLEVYKMKEPTTMPSESNSKQRSATTTETTKRAHLQNQAVKNDQSAFSYMKLLQEESIEPELLNTFDNNKQNKPSNASIPQMGHYIIES